MLTSLGNWADRWTSDWNPWTNVVGLARTLLALATAITLAFSDADVLFPVLPRALPPAPFCSGVRAASAFCMVPTSRIDLVRWVCVVALIVTASGWRPRITGIWLAWISFSIAATSPILDGGDQIASELAILLLPISLTDPRAWHWRPAPAAAANPHARIITRITSLLIVVQVAGIYFHAAIGKTSTDDWANGTALYYWLRDPYFGATGLAATILHPLTSSGTLCALLTWGVLALEFSLAAAIVMPPRAKPWLLAGGCALHLGILWVHGLVSFGLTMVAALVLYLRPLGSAVTVPEVRRVVAARFRPLLQGSPSHDPGGSVSVPWRISK
jgi:antimicrobial peptide system SdpB family protein